MKTIIGLLVIAALIYVAIQVFPPYLHNFQFQDGIEEIARFSSVDPRATEEAIREKAAKQAKDDGVPLTAEQINVTRGDGEVAIWAEYNVHIDLPVYPFDLHFKPQTKSKPLT